jgi:hypothetical protein
MRLPGACLARSQVHEDDVLPLNCRQVRGEDVHGQFVAICAHVRFIIISVTSNCYSM